MNLGFRDWTATTSQVWIASCVVAVHVSLLASLFRQPVQNTAVGAASESPVMVADLITERNDWDTVPLPEVRLETPQVGKVSLTQVRFESPLEEEVGAVVIPEFSTPHPWGALGGAATAPFALQAGLPLHRTVTVVLIVQVRSDGSLGAVSVARNNGNQAVATAAVAYARSLRWIPGTVNRRGETMFVSFPVTLNRIQ